MIISKDIYTLITFPTSGTYEVFIPKGEYELFPTGDTYMFISKEKNMVYRIIKPNHSFKLNNFMNIYNDLTSSDFKSYINFSEFEYSLMKDKLFSRDNKLFNILKLLE